MYGSRNEQEDHYGRGWPRPQGDAPGSVGAWRALPDGYTVPGVSPPTRPLCGHCSPVRPGSEVWAEDCDELAAYARPFADSLEYACAQHAAA